MRLLHNASSAKATWRYVPRVIAGALAFLLLAAMGCGDRERISSAAPQTAYTVQRVVAVLQLTDVTEADSLYLAGVPDALWDDVEAYIEEHGITFFPWDSEASTVAPEPRATSCSWDGTARRNRAVCQAHEYKFQGHNAVYFTVAGPADCYDKDLDWWVAQCVPTHGCVSDWDLLLSGGWYWRDGGWVKDVALIVPTGWWSMLYPHWPADFKAQRFLLRWNDQRTPGCCE